MGYSLYDFGGASAFQVSGDAPGLTVVDRSHTVVAPGPRGTITAPRLYGDVQHTVELAATMGRADGPGSQPAAGLTVRVYWVDEEDSTTPIGEALDMTLDALTVSSTAREAVYRGTVAADDITALLVDAGFTRVWRVDEWSSSDTDLQRDLTPYTVEERAVRV